MRGPYSPTPAIGPIGEFTHQGWPGDLVAGCLLRLARKVIFFPVSAAVARLRRECFWKITDAGACHYCLTLGKSFGPTGRKKSGSRREGTTRLGECARAAQGKKRPGMRNRFHEFCIRLLSNGVHVTPAIAPAFDEDQKPTTQFCIVLCCSQVLLPAAIRANARIS